jgi:hypothetical protein
MKFVIEIDVPELDRVMTQDKQLQALDARFRDLLELKEGGNGLLITQAIGLIEQAKTLTANGQPTPPAYQLWLESIARYHVQSYALQEHGRIFTEMKALYRQVEKLKVDVSQMSYQGSLQHLEKLAGVALAQQINEELNTIVMSQLERNEDANETNTEEIAIEA